MIKYFLALVLSMLFLNTAFAQKRDTSVYYIKNSGKVVSSKDSADFFLVILPPDTSVDKNLYIVKGYYLTGKIKFIGGMLTNKLQLKYPAFPGYYRLVLQGSYVSFFPSGNKMKVCSYEDGDTVGDEITYYPNGNLYYTKTYTKDKKVLYNECRDSIGRILVQKGNGNWLNFIDEGFKNYVEGKVNNSLAEGEWHGKQDDTMNIVYEYKNGGLISIAKLENSGQKTYSLVEAVPEFSGGVGGFIKFLSDNIAYPSFAKRHGIQGSVIISFVAEKDGTLVDVKVEKGIGGGCDEEAVRVIKLCPLWKPGMVDGKPVRVGYSVPIAFTLTK
jgi:TonB family protein